MGDRALLIKSRRGVRGVATRHVNRLKQIIDDEAIVLPRKIHDLKQRLADLNQSVTKLEDLDQQIYDTLMDDAELENEMDAVEQVNDVIRAAREEVTYVIAQLEEQWTEENNQTRPDNPPEVGVNQAPVVSSRSATRPKIQLPRFNGDILQWQSFWQAFCAEIDSDVTLADINKFNYLLGQLDNNVLTTVAGLTPSNANYAVLTDLLKERYGRKPKVIAAYMRALYTLQKPESTLKGLRSFYDLLESYVRGLESLGKPPDTYGDLLVCILLDKLPSELRKNIARQHDQDQWTLDELRKSLRGEIRVLEAGQITSSSPHQSKASYHQSTSLFASHSKVNCHYCNGEHFHFQCTKYPSADDRMQTVLKKKMCVNCLNTNHQGNDCRSKKFCRVCKAKHHSSLHGAKSLPVISNFTMSSNAKQTQEPISVLSASTLVVPTEYSVLKTAITSVLTPKGIDKTNTIVDEGSQRSLMTRKLARKVKIKSSSQEFLLLSGSTGLSNKPSVYEVVEFTLIDKKDKPIYIKAIVVDQVAKPLEDKQRERINSLPHLKKLDLAHPTTKNDMFNIELLIGADFYWSIVEDEKPIRGKGPVAVRSRIGYLVSGPLSGTAHESSNPVISLHVTAVEEFDVSCLWSLESLGIHPQKENSEEAAEYARENINYQDGKYVAKFPWKKEHPDLPPNFKMVHNMTRAILRRLGKDPALFQFFGKLIEDQLENQFIEKVPESETTKPCHYIPYHYVKKNSATTPIRIVYNCSCRARNGVSFNDCVQTGAILQNDQVGIMLRFRSHQIGLVADVEKAFHHIGLDENDRDFLRWFWLKDPSDPESELIAYRFKVIPFGAKSSPFILNSTVIHHLKQESSAVAKDMQNNIFVDNIVSGCKTQEEAIEYYNSANTIMKRAGLPLQAWGFSDPVVEEKVKKDGRLDQSSASKTLGFIWDRSNDMLSIQPVSMLSFCSVSATHKDILRGTHSLYDPLGFYSPLSVKGKILLQDLNREKVPLEQELSDQQLDRWRMIATDISSAVDQRIMSVSRPFFPFHLDRCELHIFGDASRRAYGAVAYLVQNNKVAFVMAKSKINPKKEENKEGERELSIPEAELMAAYIGTLVAETIVAALEPLDIRIKVFFWSDSQIVLFWISKPENHPRSFITNRVKKIRESTRLRAATWKYVTTDQNPADILSRGASFKEFKASDIWKSGPIWLTDRKNWPVWSVTSFKSCQILHMAQAKPLTQDDILSVIDPSKYRWSILLRVTALTQRLCKNLKLKDRSRLSWNREPLTSLELADAENIWFRVFQRMHLTEELRYLQSKKKRWRPALVSQLDLFLDPQGVIRCGGRYANANMTEAAKHPLLIPKNSQLAKLIITAVHERIFHLRIDQTITHLQQRYWIPAYRQQVAAVVHNCVKCRRVSGPAYDLPDPAPLPTARVQDSYPFSTMGLDYTGVINIRIKGTKEIAQAYILLMTCGFSRALHLEVVQDMSTESFLKAFRRYTGHHRLPRLIISDNASTFITASGYLTKLFNDHQVTRFLSDRNIQWRFIPKRAPWYGGFWERLIAMAKNVLTKMVGLNKLTLEELQTVVCEIEAVLNDRKLTNIPSEIDGLTPLTPSHLLYGERLTIFPQDIAIEEELDDPSYGERASVLSKSYLRIQNVKKSFIRMWNNVYLPSLREHHQKTRGPIKEIIKVGDIVQVHNECKRSSWKLAVIENLIRSADGKVRAADIRTANGKTNRPINKLYPLELSEEREPVVPSSLDKDSIISSNSTTDDERPAPAAGRPARRAAAKRADHRILSIAQLESIDEVEE